MHPVQMYISSILTQTKCDLPPDAGIDFESLMSLPPSRVEMFSEI